MFHVAFTPNVFPANALSAKSQTLLGALGELFKALDILGCDEWFTERVLEATKEAVANLNNETFVPAKGTWSDMGCEDDAFSIDIFCADDARYVKLDDDYLLVPHGAVGLAIGEHNHQEWLYEMPEVGEWLDVLLPHVVYQPSEDGLDAAVRSVVNGEEQPLPTITEVIRNINNGDVCMKDYPTKRYYTDAELDALHIQLSDQLRKAGFSRLASDLELVGNGCDFEPSDADPGL